MDLFTQAFNEVLEQELRNKGVAESERLVESIAEEVLPQLIDDLADSLEQDLKSQGAAMLAERREEIAGFCERNHARWAPAFDLFETFLVICTEAGESLNLRYRPQAVVDDDIVFDIIVRLHARACHIAQEILCLLISGFPDGAHARWRALHEVAVTAMFIDKHGPNCAERYYWYDVVESYKGMLQHQKYQNRLQEKGPSQEEIDACKHEYDALREQFGKPFRDPYGWAADALGKTRINFADLERDVELDHLRPYYKWASQNVHSSPKGLVNQLGLSEAKEEMLLVGPSNSGMTDPAHATALSLSQATVVLLNLDPNIDGLVIMKIILNLQDEIGDLFLSCDRAE